MRGISKTLLVPALLLMASCGGADPNDTKAIERAVGEDATLQLGQQVFQTNCARCHGSTGEGLSGPSLHGEAFVTRFPIEEDQIIWITRGGGAMPGFGTSLDEKEIEAVRRFANEILGDL